MNQKIQKEKWYGIKMKEKLLSSVQKFTQYPKQRDEIDINLDEIL